MRTTARELVKIARLLVGGRRFVAWKSDVRKFNIELMRIMEEKGETHREELKRKSKFRERMRKEVKKAVVIVRPIANQIKKENTGTTPLEWKQKLNLLTKEIRKNSSIVDLTEKVAGPQASGVLYAIRNAAMGYKVVKNKLVKVSVRGAEDKAVNAANKYFIQVESERDQKTLRDVGYDDEFFKYFPDRFQVTLQDGVLTSFVQRFQNELDKIRTTMAAKTHVMEFLARRWNSIIREVK